MPKVVRKPQAMAQLGILGAVARDAENPPWLGDGLVGFAGGL